MPLKRKIGDEWVPVNPKPEPSVPSSSGSNNPTPPTAKATPVEPPVKRARKETTAVPIARSRAEAPEIAIPARRTSTAPASFPMALPTSPRRAGPSSQIASSSTAQGYSSSRTNTCPSQTYPMASSSQVSAGAGAKKGKTKSDAGELQEKRAARFRASCPKAVLERYDRARTQRHVLIWCLDGGATELADDVRVGFTWLIGGGMAKS